MVMCLSSINRSICKAICPVLSYLAPLYDYKTKDIDKNKCMTECEKCYSKEKVLIEWIKANKIKILNSGI